MSSNLTRQDLMAITDGAKNKIIDRLLTRRDVQFAVDNARDRLLNTINTYHVENQALIRQSGGQNEQVWKRMAALESQILAARQDIRLLTQSINRLYEFQAQQLHRIARYTEPEDQMP